MFSRKSIPFTKMQATGNDFVLIDNRTGGSVDSRLFEKSARMLCDRKYGIGSDGLILLEEKPQEGLVMLYKNPDGSDAGMCGNGGRCFVLFALLLGYSAPVRFTMGGKRYQGTLADGSAGSAVPEGSGESGEAGDSSQSAAPRISTPSKESSQESSPSLRSNIRLHFPLETRIQPVTLEGRPLWQVYTNTEHLVCRVDPEEAEDLASLREKGRILRHHERFAPAGTNVNFIWGDAPEEVRLQTYERGVEDLTLSCGTGAIASALVWHHLHGSHPGENSGRVRVAGGNLTIHFEFSEKTQTYNKITLEGPAVAVFEGIYYNQNLHL